MGDTLAIKLCNIMQKMPYIQKQGYNAFHKYNYLTEADVSETVRKLLIKEKVLFVPSVRAVSQPEPGLCRVEVDCEFINAENMDERIKWSSCGDGQDKGDKGPYKAMTGAVKYALVKFFLIPTGDDPEADEETDRGKPSPQAGPTKDQLDEIFELAESLDWSPVKAKGFIKNIYGCDSTSELSTDEAATLITKMRELSVQAAQLAGEKTKPEGPRGSSTIKQQGAIHTLAGKLGWSDGKLNNFIGERHQKNSSRELSEKQASEMITHLGNLLGQDDKPLPPGDDQLPEGF